MLSHYRRFGGQAIHAGQKSDLNGVIWHIVQIFVGGILTMSTALANALTESKAVDLYAA